MTEFTSVCRDGKRYKTLSAELKSSFGRRMIKIPLSSACSCPNRDGTKGEGGCTFCTGKGGGEFAPESGSLLSQYEAGRAALSGKWSDAGFIAYFQSFSNTHCTAARLEKLLGEAASLPDVEAVRIATRADCLGEDIVEVLSRFAKRIPVGVELGLQTANDETARKINRCHTTAEFLEGFERLRAANLPVCVHLINGLPDETADDMLASARLLGEIAPEGVKIHMLHVLKGSAMGREYEKAPFPLLTREEYVDIVCRQLELLSPATVIERLTGDGDKNTLLAPLWTRNKRAVLNLIDKTLSERGTWQGRLWEGKTT